MGLWERAFFFRFRRENLLRLRRMAMRHGVWFKALSRIERVLVDLTIRVTDKVRSLTLAEKLFAVVEKLEECFESGVLRALRTVGFPLARKIGFLAKRWGNPYGESWMSDVSFAKFLAVMHINGGSKAHLRAVY